MTKPLQELTPAVMARLRARTYFFSSPDGRSLIDDDVWCRQLRKKIHVVDVKEGTPNWTVFYTLPGEPEVRTHRLPAPDKAVIELVKLRAPLDQPAGSQRIEVKKQTA